MVWTIGGQKCLVDYASGLSRRPGGSLHAVIGCLFVINDESWISKSWTMRGRISWVADKALGKAWLLIGTNVRKVVVYWAWSMRHWLWSISPAESAAYRSCLLSDVLICLTKACHSFLNFILFLQISPVGSMRLGVRTVPAQCGQHRLVRTGSRRIERLLEMGQSQTSPVVQSGIAHEALKPPTGVQLGSNVKIYMTLQLNTVVGLSSSLWAMETPRLQDAEVVIKPLKGSRWRKVRLEVAA